MREHRGCLEIPCRRNGSGEKEDVALQKLIPSYGCRKLYSTQKYVPEFEVENSAN